MRRNYTFELFKEIFETLFPKQESEERKEENKTMSERFNINAPSYLDEEDYIETDLSKYKKGRKDDER